MDHGRVPKAKSPELATRESATGKLASKPSGPKHKTWTATYTYSGYGTYRKDKGGVPLPKI